MKTFVSSKKPFRTHMAVKTGKESKKSHVAVRAFASQRMMQQREQRLIALHGMVSTRRQNLLLGK